MPKIYIMTPEEFIKKYAPKGSNRKRIKFEIDLEGLLRQEAVAFTRYHHQGIESHYDNSWKKIIPRS